jgi:hypothetical protein
MSSYQHLALERIKCYSTGYLFRTDVSTSCIGSRLGAEPSDLKTLKISVVMSRAPLSAADGPLVWVSDA